MVKRRILIVDNDHPTLHTLANALRRADFSVTCNPDPHAALATLAQVRPDALVVATALPYLDGFECVRRAKDQPGFERLPVIFITDTARVDDRAASLALGATDYVEKPLDPADIIARLGALLSRPRPQVAPSETDELSGDLRDWDVAALCTMMEGGKKSGTLMLQHRGVHGFVYFLGGQVIDAEVAQLHGLEAVAALTGWLEGTFCASYGVPDRPVALAMSTHALLLEAAYQSDASAHEHEQSDASTRAHANQQSDASARMHGTTLPAQGASDAVWPPAPLLPGPAAPPRMAPPEGLANTPRTPEEAFGLTPAPHIDQSYLDTPLPAPPPWRRAAFWVWATSIGTLLAGLLWNLTQR